MVPMLLMGFRLIAGAIASCAFIGVAVGVGLIYGSLLVSIGRNPSQRDELLRYSFIGFSLVEVSGLIGLVISLLLLFGFYSLVLSYSIYNHLINGRVSSLIADRLNQVEAGRLLSTPLSIKLK